MAIARIYQPPKTAMQSGKAKTGYWVLEVNNCEAKFRDSLMGWIGSTSTEHQISLKFFTLEAAIAQAKKMGIEYVVSPPQQRRITPKSYTDNFHYNKPTFSST
jgi:hypothetical protein